MDDYDDDQRRPALGPRQVARLLLPVFAVSTVVTLIGVVFVVTHHRSIGLFFIVVGVAGGLVVRIRLMMRTNGRR